MTLLEQMNKAGPTLTDLHVPSVMGEISVAGWDWTAVHDALSKEMERRGMEHMEKEEISKPYTMATLPDRVKAMPKHAQEIWLAAFNSAAKTYENESQWFSVANAAVSRKYKKVGSKWVLKKDDEYEVPIVKYDQDEFRGLVFGVVLSPFDEEPTEEDIDTQRDVIGREEVTEACHRFMKSGHRLDLSHEEDIDPSDAWVAQCYINPVEYQTEYGGETHTVKAGDWVMAVQLETDELKKAAQDGEIRAFSIKGTGYREETEVAKEVIIKALFEQLNKEGKDVPD